MLPNKLVKICEFAFYNCKSLDNVILPDALTAIEHSAFFGCSSLSELVIPKNVSLLGSSFINGYTNIKLKFEDTNGWQKRYISTASFSPEYYGDWEDIDSSIMADSNKFKELVKTIYNDGKNNYVYEFQKV